MVVQKPTAMCVFGTFVARFAQKVSARMHPARSQTQKSWLRADWAQASQSRRTSTKSARGYAAASAQLSA